MAVTDVLSSLLQQGTIDDHEQLLKAANDVIKVQKTDLQAQHVKAVALLKLDRFDEARQVFEDAGDDLKELARFEHAYAIYKVAPKSAAEIAASGQDRGSRHVEAQASYRSEDFERAAQIYEQLLNERGQVTNEDIDLRINSNAVDAQLEWANQGHLARSKKPSREDLEAFETAYNAACGSIARGELAQADILLKRSKDLCNALEDLSDDEKKAETLPITVQQVYVLTRLGRVQDAKSLAATLDSSEFTDIAVQGIAKINQIALEDVENPFLLQRNLEQSVAAVQAGQPFGYQRHAIEQSQHAVALATQKYEGAIRAAHEASKKSSLPSLDVTTNTLSVLAAAAHARNETGKTAIKHVLPELAKRPNDLGLVLVVIQLYILTGNNDMATFVLERFLTQLSDSTTAGHDDVRYAPGLVAAVTSLYSARGQRSHIATELAKAARHWRSKLKDTPTAGVVNLLKTAGAALVASESEEHRTLAADIFSDLASLSLSDTFIAAGRSATSDATPSGAALAPVSDLIASIDAAALEAAGIARPPQPSTTATKPAKRPADSAPAPRKAKKVKPSKQPKEYDPAKTPDPERWLPARDRSGYRPPKGKKGKKDRANMFAQGATGEDAKEGSRPQTPGVIGGEGKQLSGGGGKKAAGKKKGKGGKW